MVKYLCIRLLLLLFLLNQQACNSQTTSQNEVHFFPGEQLLEEAKMLKNQLDFNHPGLDWYISKAEYESSYQNFAIYIENGATSLNYFRELSKFITRIKCGHTRTRAPQALDDELKSDGIFMPFDVVVRGERVFVDRTFSTLPFGSKTELISINEMPVANILKNLRMHIPGDGFAIKGKDKRISHFWPYYFNLFIENSLVEYQIQYVTEEGEQISYIPGNSFAELKEAGAFQIQNKSNLELVLDEESSIAYLSIRTFSEDQLDDYEGFLSRSFQTVRDNKIRNLVLDLRGNGGGSDLYGALLVSYFTDKSFRYFDRIEVTEGYSGYGKVVEKNGFRLMTSHKGLDIQQPSINNFKGNRYALIDGNCFSTCADVASVLKINDLAILIGEETGGAISGNTSGWSETFTGKYSRITVNIPKWKYSTFDVPFELQGKGVKPHIEIEAQFIHEINDKDTYLEYVQQLIKK